MDGTVATAMTQGIWRQENYVLVLVDFRIKCVSGVHRLYSEALSPQATSFNFNYFSLVGQK